VPPNREIRADQRNSDTTGFKKPFIARGGRRIDHRRQAALHVRRPPTEQILIFNARLKLITALRRNNVIVTTEIESPGPGSDRCEYAIPFTSHAIECQSHQFVTQNRGTFFVVIPRRIFGCNRDQALGKIEHRRFREPLSQPARNLPAILALHVLVIPPLAKVL
jgi:hypothetical protein